MSEKIMTDVRAEHVEQDRQHIKLEEAQARTSINDIPLQEVLDAHLDEDPKRIARIRRKVDARLTLMLGVLYTFAFIDRGNLGNVRSKPHHSSFH